MKRILYISYDGMTDPLGQSQVIPYLQGLSRLGYKFTILSFEKKDRFRKLESRIRSLLEPAGIDWEPLWFTSKPPLLSKFYDAIKMRHTALKLQRKHQFDLVHCRSYPSSDNGLLLKRRFGVKFLFDMRGFWADEKKDGGSWDTRNLIFRQVYRHYKRKEAQLVREADAIISLTHAGKTEMESWESYTQSSPADVIPCCADMDHFSLRTPRQKEEGRQILGIEANRPVLGYLGSLGSWYMLDEMLDFFRVFKEMYPGALFLFITHSDPAMVYGKLEKFNLSETDVRIVSAERDQVPVYAKAADFSISFIKPVYSKMSSSPTKLGELLAMGIPVIVNRGVGDVEQVVNAVEGGFVIDDFQEPEYRRAMDQLPALLAKDPAVIRDRAKKYYSLEEGILRYAAVYQKLLGQ
ncbi:MAG: glycosyltransferase [Chitinophagaceae bacterium]